MSFKDLFIEHEVPPEVQEWIKGEIEAQEERYTKIEKEMVDLAATLEGRTEETVFFANDVAVDGEGTVYVTDTRTGAIYRVDET